MKPLYSLLIPLVFLFCFRCENHFKSIPPGHITIGEIRFTGSDGGEKRTRFMYSVPNGYNPEKSFPVVVALHGGGDNAAAFHDFWKSVTDTLGFVLLTPQGEERGAEDFGWTWGRDGDRTAMICLDILRKEVRVDDERIYIAGFSSAADLWKPAWKGMRCLPKKN